MSHPAETIVAGQASAAANLAGPPTADRRSDIDAKQVLVADLLRECGCEALLLFDQENLAWFTAGAVARGVLDPADLPGLLCTAEKRWLLCSNVDTQRLFDEELDGLGFELKERPWHWEREHWLAELCQGKRVAADDALLISALAPKAVRQQLQRLRLRLSPYEQVCYRALGQILGHALEATCKTVTAGETEREIAGQISHRLIRRGALPVSISVSADGRARHYRQLGYTATPIKKSCLVTATARKYGLCATASRAMSFGALDEVLPKEHDAACKVAATYVASTWPDAVPGAILAAGRRVYFVIGFEHEWLQCPQGHLTGRLPVERRFRLDTSELLEAGWAVTWRASIGAASSCDTFLITDHGPQLITVTESWPLKRIRVQGAEFTRPDLLQR